MLHSSICIVSQHLNTKITLKPSTKTVYQNMLKLQANIKMNVLQDAPSSIFKRVIIGALLKLDQSTVSARLIDPKSERFIKGRSSRRVVF